MKKYSRLQTLLTPLLMDTQDGHELETGDHYTLQLNETLQIELSDQGGNDLIVSCLLTAEEGRLDDPATLATLLQANLPGQHYPVISVGLIQEQQRVMLWTRYAFSTLNTEKLKIITEAFMTRSEQVKYWLSLPVGQVESE